MTRNQMKYLRLYHGLTQAEFSRETGVSPNLIALIEAGHRDISTTTKAKILRRYDIADTEFLTFCERMKVVEK
ncbi:helix-turn-helix transcriptional regulator [Niallia sp. Krafla_26]|uniref:helix-turn-helix transcriptional regulator n=1 Tax=Niallia sp. Krafla_26 TaxID=3064703 RepID=UPI003D16AB1C